MLRANDDDDDDDLGVELAEQKPLRHESTSKPNSAREFALVNWATGAFVLIALATVAVVIAMICAQIIAIRSGKNNILRAETCMLSLAASKYDPECYTELKTVSAVNNLLRNRWIYFIGESTARDAFHALKSLQFGLELPPSKRGDHSDQTYRSGSSLSTFHWMPFLNDIVQMELPKSRGVFSRPDYVYVSLGLHDILYRYQGLEPDTSAFISQLEKLSREARLVMLEVPPAIDRSKLVPAKAEVAHFDNEHISNWIESLTKTLTEMNLNVLILSQLQTEPFDDQADGIHSMSKNHLATDRIVQVIRWFEFPTTASPFSSAVFALAIIGTILSGICLWLQIRSYFFQVCSADSVTTYCQSSSSPQRLITKAAFLSCPQTMQKFFLSCSIVFAVMVAVYLVDGPVPMINVTHKTKSNLIFAGLYLAVFLAAIIYRQPVPTPLTGDKAFLNRLQTEEWKGMMQVAFIWYHLFDSAATYNLIRVFVASYVWMTGFGNFMFFQSKQDFSLLRILKTLFRLNFLVTVLCVTLGREWMLYYICPLHTIYFLFVWVVARIPPSPSSAQAGACKAIASILFLLAFFAVPHVFEDVFSIFGGMFLRNGSLWEWRFRANLDAFASSIGVLIACILPILISYCSKFGMRKRVKITLIAALIVTGWLAVCYPMEKSSYNRIHPFVGFIPMFAYLVIRNMFPSIREMYMPVFQFIGTITLETYLLQLHLYMSHDAKMVITYLPENPIVNFAMATSLYLLASYAIFKATVAINDFLFPSSGWSDIVLRRILPIAAAISSGVLLDAFLKMSL